MPSRRPSGWAAAEGEDGRFRVHQARPGEVGHVRGDAGFVEGEIALPELVPLGAVVRG